MMPPGMVWDQDKNIQRSSQSFLRKKSTENMHILCVTLGVGSMYVKNIKIQKKNYKVTHTLENNSVGLTPIWLRVYKNHKLLQKIYCLNSAGKKK